MNEIRTRAVVSILAAAAAALSSAAMAEPARIVKTGYKVTEIARGLDHPWSMAFLPDDSILVTERAGRLRLIKSGSLRPEPIAGVPAVHTGSQAGLFDIVLHPHFAQNALVYLTYAAGTKAANGTRVARARYDGGALRDLTVIFSAMPLKDAHVGIDRRNTARAQLVDGDDVVSRRVQGKNVGGIVRLARAGIEHPAGRGGCIGIAKGDSANSFVGVESYGAGGGDILLAEISRIDIGGKAKRPISRGIPAS